MRATYRLLLLLHEGVTERFDVEALAGCNKDWEYRVRMCQIIGETLVKNRHLQGERW